MIKYAVGLLLALCGSANAQAIYSSQYIPTKHTLVFTATTSPANVNGGAGCASGCTWTVPATSDGSFVANGCAPGGAGGGGQASASTAGGGGGGTGICIINQPFDVTPGTSVITITIPAAPAGGTAGNNGGAAVNMTISGQNDPDGGTTANFTMAGGNPGTAGAAGTGGTGGNGRGGGGAGGAAGVAGGNGGCAAVLSCAGAGGGGGGNTAGNAAVGGANSTSNLFFAAAGSGNGAGGGGGSSMFGPGQAGVAVNTSCSSTPTWSGYGGGGCGGGANGSGGPGGPGFLSIVAYY